MRRREPNHPRPLLGAAFMMASTSLMTASAVVISLRAGEPFPFEALLFMPFGAAFALFLQYVDLGVLKLARLDRPPRYRRYWRWMWMLVPPIASAVGAIAGALVELPLR